MEPMDGDLENKMTKEELLASVGASDFKSAPEDVINSITKGTIPDATPLTQAPPLEEKKITEGEVFKPSKQLLEWLSTTGERRAQPKPDLRNNNLHHHHFLSSQKPILFF